MHARRERARPLPRSGRRPTVAISLIRLQTEKVGRRAPCGCRSSSAGRSARRRTRTPEPRHRGRASSPRSRSGPVVLQDFPEDDPTAVDVPGWQPPFDLAAGAARLGRPRDARSRVAERRCSPSRRSTNASSRQTGGTTIGLSGPSIDECAAHLVPAGLAGTPARRPPVRSRAQPGAGATLGRRRREGVLSRGDVGGIAPSPSSRQMQGWFWDRTVAGRTIIELRKRLLASEDSRTQAVGRLSLVPSVQALRLGLT